MQVLGGGGSINRLEILVALTQDAESPYVPRSAVATLADICVGNQDHPDCS